MFDLSFFENLIATLLAFVNPFVALWTLVSGLFNMQG